MQPAAHSSQPAVRNTQYVARSPQPAIRHTPYAIRSTLAIIIVSYNVRDLLAACLAATYASLARSPELDAAVWVIDNASADGSAEMVAAEFPQAQLIVSTENLGFAGGNNRVLRELGFPEPGSEGAGERGSGGAGEPGSGRAGEPGSRGAGEPESRGAGEQHIGPFADSPFADSSFADSSFADSPFADSPFADSLFADSPFADSPFADSPIRPPQYVLLLNPDAEPLDDAIGRMAGYLAAHPEAGGAGAQLQYPDGSFQHGAFAFPGLLQLWFDLFPPRPRRLLDSRLNGRYPRRLYQAGRPFPIDFALGASLMVRREAIEAAGLLDEGYFMYAEEVDWCWRIQRAGWPFCCVPTAHVIHHGGASTRQFRARSFENLWRSRWRLYDRFYGPLRRRLAGRIVALGMRAEAARARSAARRGEISAEEAAARTAATDRVKRLFTTR